MAQVAKEKAIELATSAKGGNIITGLHHVDAVPTGGDSSWLNDELTLARDVLKKLRGKDPEVMQDLRTQARVLASTGAFDPDIAVMRSISVHKMLDMQAERNLAILIAEENKNLSRRIESLGKQIIKGDL